ncbi:GIP, partial [Symbiodinium necroappetens]
LHPEQLLRIRKPIFGLVDSPAAWWNKFRKTMQVLTVDHDGKKWKVVQCSLDHCIFMVQEVIAINEEEISSRFPIRDLEADKFDYVGSYIEIGESCVDVDKDILDHFEATETQKYDNMSLIGALSWM